MKTVKTKSGRVIILPTSEEDAVINAGIAADPDNPELEDNFFKRAKSAREFFSKEQLATLKAKREKVMQD